MALDPKKVIEIAKAEIGYLEKKSNSNLDSKTANAGSKNYTKYGRDLYEINFYNGNKNGVAWCDQFVDWCFVTAYGLEAALAMTFQPLGKNNLGAGCQYSFNYYKAKGRIFKDPQPGDQIFFWDSGKTRKSHTGLVEKVSGGKVYTIEGNTSGASGVIANGGGVKAKSYDLSYSRIAGYGRPDWNVVLKNDAPKSESSSDTVVKNPTVTATGPKVKITGGTVNVRSGPDTRFQVLDVAKKGETYPAVNMDGWIPVDMGSMIGWVSDKYADKEG